MDMKNTANLKRLAAAAFALMLAGCSSTAKNCSPDDLVKMKDLKCYEIPGLPGMSKWRCTDSAGTYTAEGILTGGERNGLWEISEDNPLYGKIRSTGVYLNGYKDGPWKTFYANGVLKSEANYSEGCPQGYFADYAENGILLQSGYYAGGLKTGEWKIFHFNGVMQASGSYINDEPAGEWATFYENGVQESKGAFKGGLKTGYWKFWAPNGTPHSEGSYVDGKKEGEWTFYSEGSSKKVKYSNDEELK